MASEYDKKNKNKQTNKQTNTQTNKINLGLTVR